VTGDPPPPVKEEPMTVLIAPGPRGPIYLADAPGPHPRPELSSLGAALAYRGRVAAGLTPLGGPLGRPGEPDYDGSPHVWVEDF